MPKKILKEKDAVILAHSIINNNNNNNPILLNVIFKHSKYSKTKGEKNRRTIKLCRQVLQYLWVRHLTVPLQNYFQCSYLSMHWWHDNKDNQHNCLFFTLKKEKKEKRFQHFTSFKCTCDCLSHDKLPIFSHIYWFKTQTKVHIATAVSSQFYREPGVQDNETAKNI